MNDSNLLQTLGQVSSDEAGQIFRDHLRGFVREMISGCTHAIVRLHRALAEAAHERL